MNTTQKEDPLGKRRSGSSKTFEEDFCIKVLKRKIRECDSNTTPSPGTAEDGLTMRTKRKASPKQNTPRKGAKVTGAQKPPEQDLRIRVLKRKVRDDGEGAAKTTKKRRRVDLNQDESASTSVDTESSSSSSSRRTGGKRKAADPTGEGPAGKRTRTLDLNDDHQQKDQEKNQKKDQDQQQEKDGEHHKDKDQDHQQENNGEDHKDKDQDHQQEKDGEDHEDKDPDYQQEKDGEDHEDKDPDYQQEDEQDLTVLAEFEAKYEQQGLLGEGGCGCVYAGFRKADNLPVAIKHVPKDKTLGNYQDKDGRRVSAEVAIMLKLGAGTSQSAGALAPVSLLDWYNLGPKLILVMERPDPCVDLFDYIRDKGGSLKEDEAKIILKQLVDAAKALEDQKIFHRDIKRENILIETGSVVPRVRLIDFGLGCFTKKKSAFRNFCGTLDHTPPELYAESFYRAGPTTVWQMGVVLFDSIHRKVKFETTLFTAKKVKINRRVSKDCRDFLQKCLTLNPRQRPTLEELQHHPWLR